MGFGAGGEFFDFIDEPSRRIFIGGVEDRIWIVELVAEIETENEKIKIKADAIAIADSKFFVKVV